MQVYYITQYSRQKIAIIITQIQHYTFNEPTGTQLTQAAVIRLPHIGTIAPLSDVPVTW